MWTAEIIYNQVVRSWPRRQHQSLTDIFSHLSSSRKSNWCRQWPKSSWNSSNHNNCHCKKIIINKCLAESRVNRLYFHQESVPSHKLPLQWQMRGSKTRWWTREAIKTRHSFCLELVGVRESCRILVLWWTSDGSQSHLKKPKEMSRVMRSSTRSTGLHSWEYFANLELSLLQAAHYRESNIVIIGIN